MKQNNKTSLSNTNCPEDFSSNPNKHKNCFAEIVESSLDKFIAQCWDYNDPPRFGSLVETYNKKINIIGCVTNIETKSMDPTRYPFPYKKTEEELLSEQPQIFEFLKTNFEVKVLGYSQSSPKGFHPRQDYAGQAEGQATTNTFFYLTPPYPAKIHSFVCKLSQEKTCKFFSNIDLIYTLFISKTEINLDELILAIFSQLKSEPRLLENLLSSFYKSSHYLMTNDYKRAKLFFRRIETML